VSYKQLANLYREHAFDPRIVQDWFTATHVPFDDLFSTNAIEGRVRDSAEHGGRVAVIGRSGTGKTSLVHHAIHAPGLAPIWMHVAVEKPELITEPLGFGRLLLSAIVDNAKRYLSAGDVDQSLAVAGDRYERSGAKRTKRGRAGIAYGFGSVDAAKEVMSAAPDISVGVTAAMVATALQNLFEIIRSNGVVPVVVVDDSDRFLQVVAQEPNQAPDLFSPFVTKVMPWLADFDCAKVVAVHPTYVDGPLWIKARQDGLCGTEIQVPILAGHEQLEAILDRRLDAFGVTAELNDLFAEESLSHLFELYLESPEPTIRKCLTIANAAVGVAIEQRADHVTGLHLDSAQADLG
jgi:hypothetical protein